MSRFAACVEYCGLAYRGWQRQAHCASVQEQLETALGRVADGRVSVTAAGRTDAGVHACGQIIHFDSDAGRAPLSWLRGANTLLPDDISVVWVQPVSDDFHARFKAVRRSYRYVIFNRDTAPGYLRGRVAWRHPHLDAQAMDRACRPLVGEHDFQAFRAAGCQSKSPVKTVHAISVRRSGAWVWLDITAGGFLHHMVRNIVGSLFRVGEGHEPCEWVGEVLQGRERTRAGMTAAAEGLYFLSAEYDPRYPLPGTPPPCRFW